MPAQRLSGEHCDCSQASAKQAQGRSERRERANRATERLARSSVRRLGAHLAGILGPFFRSLAWREVDRTRC